MLILHVTLDERTDADARDTTPCHHNDTFKSCIGIAITMAAMVIAIRRLPLRYCQLFLPPLRCRYGYELRHTRYVIVTIRR